MSKLRAERGALLAESTASTAVICAFSLVLIYLVAEAVYGLVIMNGLNQAAREGAREMALLYVKSGGGHTPDSASIDGVFQKIAVSGVVNDAGQFSAVWPAVYAKNSHPPPSVTVICTAAPGQSGGNGRGNFGFPWGTISLWSANFSLAGMSIKSSATYPLPP